MKRLCILLLIIISGYSIAGERMNQQEMEKIIKKMATNSKGENGFVEFEYQNTTLYLVSDISHDRMRIMSPIIPYQDLNKRQIDEIMVSNFHKALDARYAVSNDILYSAYIHPLSELSQEQLESAVKQVTSLVHTFGIDYTSGVLNFGNKSKPKKTL